MNSDATIKEKCLNFLESTKIPFWSKEKRWYSLI